MPRKKKQENQQTTEAQSAEDHSTSTTASFVRNTTSQVKPLLGGNAGYEVPCGMCGTEIWSFQYDDNLVYVCGPCAETLPE